MKIINKIISVLLVLSVLISCGITAFAGNENSDSVSVIDETALNNGELQSSGKISSTIPTIIIPGIAQTTTFLVDENGNHVTDEKGKEITGWPLYVDVLPIVKTLIFPLIFSILTQSNTSLLEKIPEAIQNAMWVNNCGPDGTTVNNIEVTKFKRSVADLSPEEKEWVYRRVPMQKFSEIAGEDKLYYFGFNSTGDVTEIAKELNDYIEMVKTQTGSSQVSLVPISMGGTIATAWLEMFKENYSSVHKIVFIVPALNGSAILGDIMTDNLRLDDDEYLYNNFLPELMGESYTTYLFNILLHFMPNSLLHQTLNVILDSVIEAFIARCPILWALMPNENFNEAYNKYIAPLGSEYDVLKNKLNLYHRAQSNLKENLNAFIEQGGIVHDICEYGLKLYPLGNQSKVLNSDTIIPSSSTAMGATFANVGETFPEGYTQKYTSDKYPDYSYISPDRVVDASTSYLPDNVWYIYGLNHEETAQDEHVIAFAIALLVDDSIKNVHSQPEKYPQFNGSCLTRELRQDYIPAAESVDLSKLSPEQATELTSALNDCKLILTETVIDTVKCQEKIDRLVNILVELGIITKEQPSEKEETLLKITKSIYQYVCKTVGNKGFSDLF